jgi:hypothetical protein
MALSLSVIALIEWNPELPGVLGFNYGVINSHFLKGAQA